MPKLVLKKKPAAAKPKGDISAPGTIANKATGLKPSKLAVFDVKIVNLVAHKENPNEQSERTFDEIVERIRRDGFDEPIHIVPYYDKGKLIPGKYLIFSGHHRVKAAKSLGYDEVPAIIREGWNEDRILIELMSRNQLRGNINPYKFTEMWDKLKARYDPEQLKQMMGLTDKKVFNALIKQIRDKLPEKAKQKLDDAKEKINSVEDLSSVLNQIFRDHGSEVDHSLMIMSYGGKKHTYIQIDAATQKRLEGLQERFNRDGIRPGEFFGELLTSVEADNLVNRMSGNKNAQIARPKKVLKK